MVHFSKSHLSKVETGGKPASPELAKLCDSALGCSGELARLTRSTVVKSAPLPGAGSGEVWMLALHPDGGHHFSTAAGPGPSGAGAAGQWEPASADRATLDSFEAMFGQLRQLGQRVSANVLLPTLVTQTQALRTMAQHTRGPDRDATLLLAARLAEYSGWMAQESGHDGHAAWWTDQAVLLAAAGGDDEMAAYGQVRRALIALYRHDAAETVALARQAQEARCRPRIRGLAAQREAQGHAIAGDYQACFRALRHAATLLRPDEAPDGRPVIGTSHVADPVAAVTGWCLYDLGYPDQAAEVLSGELAHIPAHAHRARARFGARLALALASSGEVEQACAAAQPVLDMYATVGSATIQLDLRSLSRALNRWHAHPEARATKLRLTAALHGSPPAL